MSKLLFHTFPYSTETYHAGFSVVCVGRSSVFLNHTRRSIAHVGVHCYPSESLPLTSAEQGLKGCAPTRGVTNDKYFYLFLSAYLLCMQCTHTQSYKHTHTPPHTHTHTPTHTYIHTCTHTHTHGQTHTQTQGIMHMQTQR